MIIKIKTRKTIYWPGNDWEFGCKHYDYNRGWPGDLEVHIPTQPGSYTGGPRDVKACLSCAVTKFLKGPELQLTPTRATNPLALGESDMKGKITGVVRKILSDRGEETLYWAEKDALYAFGPSRTKLNRLLPVKVEHPAWAEDFKKLLDRSTFAGWMAPEAHGLTAIGSARLAALVGGDSEALSSLKHVIASVARNRGNATSQVAPDAPGHASQEAARLLEEWMSRGMRFKDHPECGVILRQVAQSQLLSFEPAPGDLLDALAGLGWGRFARVQVERVKGKPQPLNVMLLSGSMDEEETGVIRADGGDVRLWIELGYVKSLEGLPPPLARRKRRALAAAGSYDDDDDGPDDGGNWPSTTGNPSGGGRGNATSSR